LAKRNSEGKAVFCDGKPSTNDVIQGKVGNCWLVSALSIVVQYEEYLTGCPLKELIKRKELGEGLTKGIHPSMF
jgi:hypothetical protein